MDFDREQYVLFPHKERSTRRENRERPSSLCIGCEETHDILHSGRKRFGNAKSLAGDHHERAGITGLPADPVFRTGLGCQIVNPLGSAASESGDDDIRAEPGCGQRISSGLSGLATHCLEYDESARHDPRRAYARTNHGFDNAIEHPEELDLERSGRHSVNHARHPDSMESMSSMLLPLSEIEARKRES